MRKLGLLVIHGIGTPYEDFDAKFKKKLKKKLARLGKSIEDVAYQKVFWAKFLDQRQTQYLNDSIENQNNDLRWMFVRRFVIRSLADASAYQSRPGQKNRNYNNIVRKIFEAMRMMRKELGTDNKPLIIIAHSLGAFIINNYIWDAHKIHDGTSVNWEADLIPEGAFEHMINVTGMMTIGCNIPLFVLGNDPIEAIRFPHPELAAQYKEKSRWDNYYDPDDVLGWPLKEVQYSYEGNSKNNGSHAYGDVVTKDIPIQVMKFLAWTPKAHIDYWQDNKFVEPVAKYLSEFL